jgi:hypothetical protein
VSIEYGDADFLHPEFVQRIDLSVVNDQNVKLREMTVRTDMHSSDGEGRYRLGLVIDPVEKPKDVVVGIQSDTYGPAQTTVSVKEDTGRAIQGS